MRTGEEWLNKLKWDKAEHPQEYVFYYQDRFVGLMKFTWNDIVSFQNGWMELVNPAKGEEEDTLIMVPMHRLRRIERNGEIVWLRQESGVKR
jgi:uncharacterized protein (UPF0248 family)